MGKELADYSDNQLKIMLAKERRSVLQQIIGIKQRMRDDETKLTELQTRMKDIEASENYLA